MRLSAMALKYLAETQAGTDVKRGLPDSEVDGGEPEVGALFRRLLTAPQGRDGSITVDLDREETRILLIYAEAWAAAALENVGVWTPAEGLGEFNSARALVRNLGKAMSDQSAPSL